MEMIRKGKTGEGNRVRDFADMCFFTETSEERFETLLPKLYGKPEKTVKDHILLENDGQLKGLILPQTMIWKAETSEERFETLLPKLYGKPEKTVKDHILLENDGQLKGLILPQTMIWKAGDRELLTGHIGTVCVSPDYRERGAMSRLMKAAVEELEKAGCVCIVLNGQRQRYEHYDFVPTGGKIQFVFRPANVKEEQAEGYELKEFTQEDLEEIEKLFCKNVLHMKREKRDFSDGQLKGLILPQTMIWKAGDRELLTGHIGTVCVSPDYRERGAMSRLMKSAVEELELAGCVCIVLNGQRQRYQL